MRTFLALELNEAARSEVARVQKVLAATLDGLRWVRPDLVHITLRFLGELDPGDVTPLSREVAQEVAGQEPFEARLETLGSFPPRGRARVVWVGVGAGSEPMGGLADRVTAALARFGLPRDRRPFSPHVTLGRARRGPVSTAPLAALKVIPTPFPVERVTLFESRLSPRGPKYYPLARFDLGATL